MRDFYRDFYARRGTGIQVNTRLALLLKLYQQHREALGRSVSVLDVGCGHEAVLLKHLHPADQYTGCDIVPPVVSVPAFVAVDLNEDSLAETFSGATFDVIFCGEVIEHVFNPDALLEVEYLAAVHAKPRLLGKSAAASYRDLTPISRELFTHQTGSPLEAPGSGQSD